MIKKELPIDGEKLRSILEEKEISMTEVSHTCGLSDGMCSKWTRRGSMPKFAISAIALEYNIQYESYKSDEPKPAEPLKIGWHLHADSLQEYQEKIKNNRTEISESEFWERLFKVLDSANEKQTERMITNLRPIIRNEVYKAVNAVWNNPNIAIVKGPRK